MFGRYNSLLKLRQLEDKNLRELETDQLRDRASMNPTHSTKQGVLMILGGIFFAITLTAFEYALKNPEISEGLRSVFKVGFFASLGGIFYVPYGLYNLIKGFGRE